MFIKKVRVKGSPDEFGGRSVSIKTRDTSFETPCRVSTSTEFNYKKEIPCDSPIDNPISEIISDFNTNELERFLEGNGPFKTRLDRSKNNKKAMSYSGLLLYPQIPKSFELNLRARKEFIELQLMCGVDLISHPIQWSKKVERELESLVDEVDDRSGGQAEVMPYLDMGLERGKFNSLINKLKEMTEAEIIHSVGLIHRPRENYIQNYLTLWEMRDFDFWIHMSGIPRRKSDQSPSAEIHDLQYYGIDTFSIRTSRYYPPQKNKDEIELKSTTKRRAPPPAFNIKRFDDESLGYLKMNEWNGDYPKDKACDCSVCHGRTRQQFEDEYIIGLDGKENQRRISQANGIHELFTSSAEFEISRRYIKEGNLAGYVKNKRYFPIKDKTLNGF